MDSVPQKPAVPTRILLVDDNDQLRRLLARVLDRAGYRVIEARHGGEALAHQRREPADLVITDLIMPEKEGIETILELRQVNPQTRIIAMSGGGRVNATDYLTLAAALGASRTMAKPFSEEELLTAVREALA